MSFYDDKVKKEKLSNAKPVADISVDGAHLIIKKRDKKNKLNKIAEILITQDLKNKLLLRYVDILKEIKEYELDEMVEYAISQRKDIEADLVKSMKSNFVGGRAVVPSSTTTLKSHKINDKQTLNDVRGGCIYEYTDFIADETELQFEKDWFKEKTEPLSKDPLDWTIREIIEEITTNPNTSKEHVAQFHALKSLIQQSMIRKNYKYALGGGKGDIERERIELVKSADEFCKQYLSELTPKAKKGITLKSVKDSKNKESS